jgi:hypothetical protein
MFFEDEYVYRCPLQLITHQTSQYYRFYGFYKNGYLPLDGGLLYQSHKLLQAFDIIDAAVNKHQKEQEKTRREDSYRR